MYIKEVNDFFSLFICNSYIFSCVPLGAQKFKNSLNFILDKHYQNLGAVGLELTLYKCNKANVLRLSKIYTKSAAVSGSEKGRICLLKECTIRLVN